MSGNSGQSTNISGINLGELSKPANTLIEKISDAVGGLFRPWQIKRVAKAEAEAALIEAKGQIQVTEHHLRAMHRFVEEEAQKQANMESITSTALPLLEVNSQPDKIDKDWITNFFDKCRIVSDSDMQMLWARVLAGEANRPGSFSRRTVNLMADLDQEDAEWFTQLCGYCWILDTGDTIDFAPLVYNLNAEVYSDRITFNLVTHLENAGLIRCEIQTGFTLEKLPKQIHASYFGQKFDITFSNDANNRLRIGSVIFTQAGNEMLRICRCEPVDGFVEYVRDKFKRQGAIELSPA